MLEDLNPEQRRAVEHFEGPCLVLAGAGSGKTRVLTTRVCHLVLERGVPPDRILAVTFTNKAAQEMRERVARILGDEPSGIRMGTFHALGAGLLRRHAPLRGRTRTFTIRDAEQSLREVRKAQKSVDVDPVQCSPRAVLGAISDAKNHLVGVEDFVRAHRDGRNLFLKRVSLVYPAYQEALRRQDAVDFDDLLVEPVRLFEGEAELLRRYRRRFAFILVDEYQDTNRAQFRLLELLAGDHGNLMVVGDDDQSIYGWRGADIRNILDFERSFPGAEVVRLERNYRSTPVILEAANTVIRQNVDRREKTMRTHLEGGARVTLLEAGNEADESRWIVAEIERRMLSHPEYDLGDFAVLYRTNAQSLALEDRFLRRQIRHRIVGVRFYERREIQDVLAYLRLIANPRDMDAFDRAVNYPRRGVGRVTLERLAAFARVEGIDMLRAAERADRVAGLTAPARRGLLSFAGLIRRHRECASHRTAGELLEELVAELDLVALLRSEGPEGEDRAENVLALIARVLDFEAESTIELEGGDREAFTDLDLYLQQAALATDPDFLDDGTDAVTLMTLHGAKGMEFPVVFIAGLEEGLFPLARSYDDPRDLEEERRLLYVGITRAMEKLYLTYARRRRRAGETTYGRLSSFVRVLEEDVERETTRLASRSWTGDMRTAKSPAWGTPRAGFAAQSGSPDEDGFNQDRPRYVKGERVVHRTFGSGTIVEVSGFGRDLKATVDFDEAGRKRLLVRYAGLERDWP